MVRFPDYAYIVSHNSNTCTYTRMGFVVVAAAVYLFIRIFVCIELIVRPPNTSLTFFDQQFPLVNEKTTSQSKLRRYRVSTTQVVGQCVIFFGVLQYSTDLVRSIS